MEEKSWKSERQGKKGLEEAPTKKWRGKTRTGEKKELEELKIRFLSKRKRKKVVQAEPVK